MVAGPPRGAPGILYFFEICKEMKRADVAVTTRSLGHDWLFSKRMQQGGCHPCDKWHHWPPISVWDESRFSWDESPFFGTNPVPFVARRCHTIQNLDGIGLGDRWTGRMGRIDTAS